ncbi:MAG: flagellar basal body L-ring protein FlgH [bacterium]
MKRKISEILIMIIILSAATPVFAESLFRTGISQGVYYTQPRSLFNTIKAKSIGDVITVLIEENSSATSQVTLDIANTSSAKDAFTPILNTLFKTDKFKSLDGYGGNTTTGNSAKVVRTTTTTDIITAQVVQILPNGNLVIQGKKSAINSGEKAEILLSGVLDPRFITNSGEVSSKYVANLQYAVVGKGTTSSSDSEGLVNKFMKVLF